MFPAADWRSLQLSPALNINRVVSVTPTISYNTYSDFGGTVLQKWNVNKTSTFGTLTTTGFFAGNSSVFTALKVGDNGSGGLRVKVSNGNSGEITFQNGYGWSISPGSVAGGSGGAVSIANGTDALKIQSANTIAWSVSDLGGANDLILRRDAANTLGIRNGVNAQAINLYNTYTDASNYERGYMRFVGNVFQVGTEILGTGVARASKFGSINIATTREVTFDSNYTYPIMWVTDTGGAGRIGLSRPSNNSSTPQVTIDGSSYGWALGGPSGSLGTTTTPNGPTPRYRASGNIMTADVICGLSFSAVGSFPAGANRFIAGSTSYRDSAPSPLYVSGGHAADNAVTNITGAALYLLGGYGAFGVAGAANGGDVIIGGGLGYGTGRYGYVKIQNLPTTDPGVPDTLWNSSGNVVMSGYVDSGSGGSSVTSIPSAVNITSYSLLGGF